MAVLKSPSGVVEVCLQKAPYDTTEPVFFNEYAQLGTWENDNEMQRSRYIVPEDTTYAIFICMTKGFEFEPSSSLVWVRVYEATNKEIWRKHSPNNVLVRRC